MSNRAPLNTEDHTYQQEPMTLWSKTRSRHHQSVGRWVSLFWRRQESSVMQPTCSEDDGFEGRSESFLPFWSSRTILFCGVHSVVDIEYYRGNLMLNAIAQPVRQSTRSRILAFSHDPRRVDLDQGCLYKIDRSGVSEVVLSKSAF